MKTREKETLSDNMTPNTPQQPVLLEGNKQDDFNLTNLGSDEPISDSWDNKNEEGSGGNQNKDYSEKNQQRIISNDPQKNCTLVNYQHDLGVFDDDDDHDHSYQYGYKLLKSELIQLQQRVAHIEKELCIPN